MILQNHRFWKHPTHTWDKQRHLRILTLYGHHLVLATSEEFVSLTSKSEEQLHIVQLTKNFQRSVQHRWYWITRCWFWRIHILPTTSNTRQYLYPELFYSLMSRNGNYSVLHFVSFSWFPQFGFSEFILRFVMATAKILRIFSFHYFFWGKALVFQQNRALKTASFSENSNTKNILSTKACGCDRVSRIFSELIQKP
jgi:hypothetical protein